MLRLLFEIEIYRINVTSNQIYDNKKINSNRSIKEKVPALPLPK